jgi:hypothetical protein
MRDELSFFVWPSPQTFFGRGLTKKRGPPKNDARSDGTTSDERALPIKNKNESGMQHGIQSWDTSTAAAPAAPTAK